MAFCKIEFLEIFRVININYQNQNFNKFEELNLKGNKFFNKNVEENIARNFIDNLFIISRYLNFK